MNDLITEAIIGMAKDTARMAEEEEKPSVTTKCFEDGCAEDIVLMERYHAGGQGVTARWELKDGAWKSTGVDRFDQGTHVHLFCAAYDGEAHFYASICTCHDVCRNDCKGECELECTCECVCDFSAREGPPGHEYKEWGRYLPEVLKLVVYQVNFSKVKCEDKGVRERPRRWSNYNRAKSVTKQMLTEIVDIAIEAVQQGKIPDGVRELKDGRLVFNASKILGEHGNGPNQTIEGRVRRLKDILNEKLDHAGFVPDAHMGYRRP